MVSKHDKQLALPLEYDEVCGAVQDEHVCSLPPHTYDQGHSCPCDHAWMGDPNGPDFIRL